MNDSQLFEIPLQAQPQRFRVSMAGVEYSMRTAYLDAPEAGWTLDINDVSDNSIIAGIPLVPGIDLLAQYQYLGLGVALIVFSSPDLAASPTYEGLGTTSRLYFQVQ